MDFERLSKQLNFITEIDKVKQIIRQTLLLDASRRENDAEHAWHMAMGILILSEYANEPNLNVAKVVKMALIHDLVEIDAGDTYAYDEKGYRDKEEREKKAADRIFGLLPKDQEEEYRSLWNEFEAGETPEAQFAVALDYFMPILHNYKTKGAQWQKNGVTSEKVLTRNKKMEKGSKVLWEYIQSIVADAIKKGYLKE